MTTFACKLKSQGCTWALLGATTIALGTATAPTVAAEEIGTASYVQIVSTQEVSYTAIITRGTDAINTKPWGTAGFQTISSSQTYLGTEVTVTQEQVADNGVTWALVSMDGQEIGWIAKAALTPGSYAKVVSTNSVDYPATITRDTDAINTQPWGAKGYRTIASSSTYYGKTVHVSQEETMDYGVTWALVSIDGKEIGWIAKAALTQGSYSQVTSTTDVDYSATVTRDTDAINTQPWGAKGYQTIGSSSGYLGKSVAVNQEKVMDYGVTWALVTLDGKELGWIAKDALTVQTYAQIVSETIVDYPATISRGTDAINTAPWGVKGYQTVGSSADYAGQSVKITKEQVTDYGVTWAQISLNGEVLGWIAKAGLNQPVITYGSEYTATENEVDFPILYIENAELEVGVENIISAGTNGYDLVTYKDKLSDGIKVDTIEVSRTGVKAVRQVVEVGTKVIEVVPTTPQTAEQLQATIDMTLLNNEFLALVNAERLATDVTPFTYDSTIQDEADQRVSDEVSALDFYAPNLGMDHNRPDGSPYYSLLDPEKSSAENLLLNTLSASGETYSVNEKELATLMFNQWKASLGHYRNMIHPELNANAVSIQFVDKDGWLVYVASELLVFNSNW